MAQSESVQTEDEGTPSLKKTKRDQVEQAAKRKKKMQKAKRRAGLGKRSLLMPGEEASSGMETTHDHLAAALMFLMLFLAAPITAMFPFVATTWLRRDINANGPQWAFLAVFLVSVLAYRLVEVGDRGRWALGSLAVCSATFAFVFLDYAAYEEEGGDDLYPYLAVFLGLANSELVFALVSLLCLQRRVYVFSLPGLAAAAAAFFLAQGAVAALLLAPDYEDVEDSRTVLGVVYIYCALMSAASAMLALFLCSWVLRVSASETPIRDGFTCFAYLAGMQLFAASGVYLHQAVFCYDENTRRSECII